MDMALGGRGAEPSLVHKLAWAAFSRGIPNGSWDLLGCIEFALTPHHF